MKIYRIAQEELYIDVEELPDRIRVYLKRRDGKQNEFGEDYVGKLTIQFDLWSEGKDMVTAFRVDPKYRGTGWGRKMMEVALRRRPKGRQLFVKPEPYGGNIGSPEYNAEIDGLHDMYGKFGFEEYQDNFMIKN